jgi:3-oxoacyl-[acyl-carrier protein] reductase
VNGAQKLQGKVALVTGASQGLGYAIADAFAREGSDLIICSRSVADVEGAAAQIALHHPARRVISTVTDVSSQAEVETLFALAQREFGRLDVLACNAGLFGALGPIDEVNWDEWKYAIEVNLLGTVLCVRAALPLLRRSAMRPKIVITSGGGAERAHPFVSAYGASKAGLIRFGECLAAQLPEFDVNMLAPGRLLTRMVDQIIAAGPRQVGQYYYDAFVELKARGTDATPENAADLAVYLASSESDGITGRLIHAVRDNWRRLAEHREELRKSDVFQLRLIAPQDRGFSW